MEQTCPNCDRHCPIDNLHCGRGREYFGLSVATGRGKEHRERAHHTHGHEYGWGKCLKDQPRVIQLLRQCGHALHHGDENIAQRMLASLSYADQCELEQLLKKCVEPLQEHRGRG